MVLRSADLHIARVLTRVASGGHNIPAETILRRYERSLASLPAAIKSADQAILYDNTAGRPATLRQIDKQAIIHNGLDEADLFHVRIADLIGDGLGLSTDAVLRAAKHG